MISSTAHAQSRKELSAQNQKLTIELRAVQTDLAAKNIALADMLTRLDFLENSLRTITGDIELLQFTDQTIQTEMRSLAHLLTQSQQQNNIGRRTTTTTSLTASPPPTLAPNTQSNTSSAPSLDAFNAGRNSLRENNYPVAIQSFTQYLTQDLSSEEKGIGNFLLGEGYFFNKSYTQAIQAYLNYMRLIPKDTNMARATLRLAASAHALNNSPLACSALVDFEARYPHTTPDLLAQARLQISKNQCAS